MNTQPERRQRSTGAKKRGAAQSGPIAAPQASEDVAIVHMAATEVTARNVALRTMIAEAAYHRAEKRGFEPGHELEDWLAAEAQVAHTQSLSQSSPAEPADSESTP